MSTLDAILLFVGGIGGFALAAPSATVSSAIWTGSPDVALPLIARHSTIWRLANIGFVVATVLSAAGLFVLSSSLGANGEGLARAAAVAYAMAGTAWLVTLSIRLGITPGVAARYVADATLDPAFAPLAGLGGVLFAAFILVGTSSLVALGAAVVLGGVLPAWTGWVILALSVAILGGYLLTGDTLPAFVYLPTIMLGIVLLLTAG